MFKFNEEKYGVLSTYDSSLSTYTYVESPPADLADPAPPHQN